MRSRIKLLPLSAFMDVLTLLMFLLTDAALTLLIQVPTTFRFLISIIAGLRLRFMLAEVLGWLGFRLTDLPWSSPIAPAIPSRSSTRRGWLCPPPLTSAFILRTSPFYLIPARRLFPARDRDRLRVLIL